MSNAKDLLTLTDVGSEGDVLAGLGLLDFLGLEMKELVELTCFVVLCFESLVVGWLDREGIPTRQRRFAAV